MKAFFYSIAILSIFTICSCKKEQPIVDNTTPKVTAKVDGRLQSTEGQFAATVIIHSNGVQIRFPFDNTLQFYIEDFIVGDYVLGRNNFNEASLQKPASAIGGCCYSTYVHDFSDGLFSITKIDEENGTFDGEFKCTIPNIDNPSQQIEVTSGTFSNIPFSNDTFPSDKKFKASFSIENKDYHFWESGSNTDNDDVSIGFNSTLKNFFLLELPTDLSKGIIDVGNIPDFSTRYIPNSALTDPVIKTTGSLDVIQNDEKEMYILFNLELEHESGEIIILENGTFEYFK